MNKSMKILLFFFCTGFLLALPITLYVHHYDPETNHLSELDRLSENLLDAAKRGDWERARQYVVRLAELFPDQKLPASIRLESLNAVTEAILEARQEFQSAHASEDQLLWYATRVRMAIDALRERGQPLWKHYAAAYAGQMQQLLQAAVQRDLTVLRAQFAENHRLFLAIFPALSVQLPEQRLERIRSVYEVLARELRTEQPDWQIVREALRELSGSMQEAFSGEAKSVFGQLLQPRSPQMLAAMVALVVTSALAYVAWKKYAAERGKTV